jgi:hypothetical protein
MTTSLYWNPVVKPKTHRLPDALKFILRRIHRDGQVTMTMREADLPYLHGLRDAGVDGALELIEAIDKHDEVELSEE